MDWRKGYNFKDVLIVPNYSDFSSRTEPDTSTYLCRDWHISHPIIPANMDQIATPEMLRVQRQLGGGFIAHRFYDTADPKGLPEFITMGIRPFLEDEAKWRDEVRRLCSIGIKGFCIDIAHAHNKYVLKAVDVLKTATPAKIIVGNIATERAAQDLCLAGVDAVKVGIGGGYACATRDVTGIGVPQLTAVRWCSDVCKDFGIPVISDGGHETSADIVKSLAAGADTVMIGRLLAGTDEASGEVVEGDSGKYKQYWGQASAEFQNFWFGHVKEDTVPEGTVKLIPYSGSAKKVIQDLVAGVRSGMTYIGASNIDKLHKKAKFVEVVNG